ncbi:hypothetical protein F511_45888 [Dorcoceras hygrometricum]|uniref:Uncharacterized protein n=1 Tax=Dorcoceras hygrometricum TaxID=472368 RepID=A0A2Z6ZVE4_9LAMI|nr:hypothetical protein F511_45888 [Dorcoceras hygrometricum]
MLRSTKIGATICAILSNQRRATTRDHRPAMCDNRTRGSGHESAAVRNECAGYRAAARVLARACWRRRMRRWRGRVPRIFDDLNLKFSRLDTIRQYRIDQIREPGSDTTVGVATADLDHASRRACTRRPDEIGADGFSSSRLAGTIFRRATAAAAASDDGSAA